MPDSAPPLDVLDLFAGAGGWDEGLRSAGFGGRVLGIDNDATACRAAQAAGHERLCADISALDPADYAGVDGLIASPPCQSFSQAGKRRGIDDSRGALVREPLRWALELRPRWVACEQVPAVLPIWESDAAALEELGYSTWTGILDAADYGVPQRRRRAVLIARRDGTAASAPTPTTADRQVTMAEAIGWGMTARPYFTLAAARTTGGPDKEKCGGSGARAALYAERAAGRWAEPEVTELDGSIRLRIEDASVVMGFRRDYPWTGTKTQHYRQLSNAVAPPLARAILEPLAGGVARGGATAAAA